MKTPAETPVPETIGAKDLTQAKVFTGPRGALVRGSHGELCFLHPAVQLWVEPPLPPQRLPSKDPPPHRQQTQHPPPPPKPPNRKKCPPPKRKFFESSSSSSSY